ncbi:MAG: hypothetical protein IJL17_16750 [Kiritimatiellae bacterium]|nr:hypothetical protein [Kiritimatiellia bacterium]
MSVVIDLPPVMAQEAKGFANIEGISLEKMFLDCIAAELARRRASKDSLDEWEREFKSLVGQSEGRLSEPYKFRRQDAYEEVLA